jgi:hypothetical protein
LNKAKKNPAEAGPFVFFVTIIDRGSFVLHVTIISNSSPDFADATLNVNSFIKSFILAGTEPAYGQQNLVGPCMIRRMFMRTII